MTLRGSVDKVWICWSNIYALIRKKMSLLFLPNLLISCFQDQVISSYGLDFVVSLNYIKFFKNIRFKFEGQAADVIVTKFSSQY